MYCSGQPGGPPAVAIFLRASWSMGKVRDVYICWEVGGNNVVGHVLAVLDLMSPKFAVSSPRFIDNGGNLTDWIEEKKLLMFGMVIGFEMHNMLLQMCLAMLIYHQKHIFGFANNHCIWQGCILFTSLGLGLGQSKGSTS